MVEKPSPDSKPIKGSTNNYKLKACIFYFLFFFVEHGVQ